MTIPIETANVIECRDLEALIEETYGMRVSIPRLHDCNNESFLRIDAVKQPGDADVEEYMETWRAGVERWFDLEAIFIDLANRDLIPEGKYYILVSW